MQASVWVDVTKHGVVGNDSTDDVAAIEAIAASVSAAGGGTLYFPRRTYKVSRSIRCSSNITYRGEQGAVIHNAGTSVKTFDLGAFMPGYIHGYGFWATNGAGHIFPRMSISDVAQGATTITTTVTGSFASVQVGDFVAVRSSSNYVQTNIEVPNQLYFSKVYSKSGDTLTLMDASPYAITGAAVHHLVGNPTDGQSLPMFMVENVKIEGFGVDAHFPVAGGGCYLSLIHI